MVSLKKLWERGPRPEGRRPPPKVVDAPDFKGLRQLKYILGKAALGFPHLYYPEIIIVTIRKNNHFRLGRNTHPYFESFF